MALISVAIIVLLVVIFGSLSPILFYHQSFSN